MSIQNKNRFPFPTFSLFIKKLFAFKDCEKRLPKSVRTLSLAERKINFDILFICFVFTLAKMKAFISFTMMLKQAKQSFLKFQFSISLVFFLKKKITIEESFHKLDFNHTSPQIVLQKTRK
jgi:hypothetical protein